MGLVIAWVRSLAVTLGACVFLAYAVNPTSAHVSTMGDCPAFQARVYIAVNNDKEGPRIDVFCGNKEAPESVIRNGLTHKLTSIAHDVSGHVYVGMTADRTSNRGEIVEYDSRGDMLSRIGHLREPSDILVAQDPGTVTFSALTGEAVTSMPSLASESVQRLVAKGNPLKITRVVSLHTPYWKLSLSAIDDEGLFYYGVLEAHALQMIDLRNGRVLAPFKMASTGRTATEAISVGPKHTLYAIDNFGRIREYDIRSRTLIRSLNGGSTAIGSWDVLAVSPEGVVYASNGAKDEIWIYAARSGAPLGTIKGLPADAFAFDDAGRAYILSSEGPDAGGPGGIYVYGKASTHLVRAYLERGTTGAAIIGMTLVSARLPTR